MEVRGRMELRQSDARGILYAAFKVCLSIKSVFLLILLLTVAYESAIERYAFTLTTADGKATLQLSPESQQQAQNQSQIQHPAPQESFLSRLFSFSISLPDPSSQLPETHPGENPPPSGSAPGSNPENHPVDDDEGNSRPSPQADDVESHSGNEFLPEDGQHADVEPQASEGEEKLPALKIKYTGNVSESLHTGGAFDEFNMGFFSSRFQGGRRGLHRGTTDPSIGLGVLLLAFVAFLLVLAVVFFMLCFNQAVVPAVLGFSAISVFMGKPVHLRRALSSGLRVGLSRLLWLSAIYSITAGAHSFLLSRVLLRSSDDAEELLYRLSTMPFALVSIFRDEVIAKQGIVKEAALFVAGEYVLDLVTYAVFIVACWVTFLERDYKGVRAFKRSWELLWVLPGTALGFRVCEGLVAGRSSKFLIRKALGSCGALFLLGAVDLYMTVAWLLFYFAARSKERRPEFGHRDLDEFLETLR